MSSAYSSSIKESKTLWVGDVETWMDETYIKNMFQNQSKLIYIFDYKYQEDNIVAVKIIRDKHTGLPAGYGFAEFINHEIAQKVLNTYNGTIVPGTSKTFRLNWAVHGGGSSTASSQKNLIYIGDLDPSVTDQTIIEFFTCRYKTVVEAKVIADPISKVSKGYGFVNFSSFEDSQRAMNEMQGVILKSRPLKTSQAFCKKGNETNFLSNYGAQNIIYNPYQYSNLFASSQTNTYNPQIIQQQQPSYGADYNSIMQTYMSQYMSMGDMNNMYNTNQYHQMASSVQNDYNHMYQTYPQQMQVYSNNYSVQYVNQEQQDQQQLIQTDEQIETKTQDQGNQIKEEINKFSDAQYRNNKVIQEYNLIQQTLLCIPLTQK